MEMEHIGRSIVMAILLRTKTIYESAAEKELRQRKAAKELSEVALPS